MNAMEKKQTSFRIDSETLKNLKFLALEQDKSLNDIILEAIRDLLKKYEKNNSLF